MSRLKGKNQIERFRRIAEELTSKIAAYEGVAGVVFIGGLARGFADKFSDVDVTAFLNRRDERLRGQIRGIGLEGARRCDVDVDLEIHYLEDFKRGRLHEVDKWELSRAKIVFDPQGDVKKVFEEKLRVSKNFWVKRIVVCGEYLKWYCCPPRNDVSSIAECWVKRGDLVSAHYCLTYSIDLMLRVIFALNKEFLPAPKWRIFYSYALEWLPENYKRLASEAMIVKDFSVKDSKRRLKAIRKLWHGILPKIKEETGLTTTLISKYYVEKVLHQA